MSQALKLVFSNYNYVILAAIITIGLFIPLAIISEYIFLEPYVVSHVPSDRLGGFLLIVAVSVLSGIVLTMNVFRIKALRSQARLYNYEIATQNFGSFEMFSWIGDVNVARDLIQKASKRFKIKVLEGAYKPNVRVYKTHKTEYAAFGIYHINVWWKVEIKSRGKKIDDKNWNYRNRNTWTCSGNAPFGF